MNDFYQGVPLVQLAPLQKFRATHPEKSLRVAETSWTYLVTAPKPITLLILPGALFTAEHIFHHIESFEDQYQVIVPSYPPLTNVDELVEGIAAILEQEQKQVVSAFGLGYGAMVVAQVFVQRFPARVQNLILTGAGPLLVAQTPVTVLAIVSSMLTLLPEPLIKNLYQLMLNQIVQVLPAEQVFWKAYLRETFAKHLTKAHITGSFAQATDTIRKYAFDKPNAKPYLGKVLILGGEKDPLSTPNTWKEMAKFYPQAQIKTLTSVSHSPLSKTDALKYAEAIKEFINKA